MYDFKGIKRVSGITKDLNGWNGHVQIIYDFVAEALWCNYFTTCNEWIEYGNNCIVWFTTKKPMTMKEIKSRLNIEISDHKQYEAEMKAEHENQLKYAKEMKKYDYME